MSNDTVRKTLGNKILVEICVGVLCVILVAGLWPFNPHPKNEVSWLRNDRGVRFGERGVILSTGIFEMMGRQGEASSSFEIWLQPDSDNRTNTILAFSRPESPKQFRLQQYVDGLLVQRDPRGRQPRLGNAEIEIDHVFRREKQAFITITAGAQGAQVYVNGSPVKTSADIGLESSDFAGQLVLGASPVTYDAWSGLVRGAAIYNRELTRAQVLRHYETWTGNGRPEGVEKEGVVALYLFEEGAGRVIHNQVTSGPDLRIPRSYEILHKTFLEWPWKDFRLNRTYLMSVAINVAGFIPFGFFFCAYLLLSRRSSSAVFATVILGSAVSLSIEVLQGYLPTRSSDVTDVITNTVGTMAGAMLFSCRRAHAILAKAGVR